MRELNIEFMDLYKSVDRFIRDAYYSNGGISEYIRLMERDEYKETHYVRSWKSDYDMLKHLRWIRNQLSHEVGYESDICEEADYDWLESFHQRLYSSRDPLALMHKQESAEAQRRREYQRCQQAELHKKQNVVQSQVSNQQTFWQKIKSFFFGS